MNSSTLGVDLAAEPAGTAFAVIEWSAERAQLTELRLGATDDAIVIAAQGAAKVGIDCALGWPDEFVAFLQAHAAIRQPAVRVTGDKAWRSGLAYRETDRVVRERTGRWPLSVATDRLGLTAMRCAGLLQRLGEAGLDVDRSGTGDIAEVYPAASLRLWGFDTRGYKQSDDVRARLIDRLLLDAPWLELGEHRPLMVRSCDAFDAVIASLITRAAELGSYSPAAPGPQSDRARREGWIALPAGPLGDLVG